MSSYSVKQVEPKSSDLFTAINFHYEPFVKDFNEAKEKAINENKSFFRPSSDGNSIVLVKNNGDQIKYSLCYVHPITNQISHVTKTDLRQHIPEYI
jgi:hypothetical protein